MEELKGIEITWKEVVDVIYLEAFGLDYSCYARCEFAAEHRFSSEMCGRARAFAPPSSFDYAVSGATFSRRVVQDLGRSGGREFLGNGILPGNASLLSRAIAPNRMSRRKLRCAKS